MFRQVLWKTTNVYLFEYNPASNTLKMKIVASDLAMANGITLDTSKEHVYVADS